MSLMNEYFAQAVVASHQEQWTRERVGATRRRRRRLLRRRP